MGELCFRAPLFFGSGESISITWLTSPTFYFYFAAFRCYGFVMVCSATFLCYFMRIWEWLRVRELASRLAAALGLACSALTVLL